MRFILISVPHFNGTVFLNGISFNTPSFEIGLHKVDQDIVNKTLVTTGGANFLIRDILERGD